MPSALRIQAKLNFGFAEVIVADPGIDNTAAIHFGFLANEHRNEDLVPIFPFALHLEDFGPGCGHVLFDRFIRIWIDKAKLEIRSSLNYYLGALHGGSGKTGHLDQDAIAALRLEKGFSYPEFIDAFAEDFDSVRDSGAGIKGSIEVVGPSGNAVGFRGRIEEIGLHLDNE